MIKHLFIPAAAVLVFSSCASDDKSTTRYDYPPPSSPPTQTIFDTPATSTTPGSAGGYSYDYSTPTTSSSGSGPVTAGGEYTVKSGDSLWKIARDHNTNVVKIKELNNLTTDVIRPGQILQIPASQ
jgi:LysM repeat protein